MRNGWGWMLLVMSGATTLWGASFDRDAIRLNNRGVARMSQQFTQRAADDFAAAFQKDPRLAQAAINDGIALLTLQKLNGAEKVLDEAIALDPSNAQAWYNLGLVQHANADPAAALASFQKAASIDPKDADSLYFEGVCYQDTRQSVDGHRPGSATLLSHPAGSRTSSARCRVHRSTQQDTCSPDS